MKIIKRTLSNGLPVIFIHSHDFPTLTTMFLVGAGSRYENKKNNGIAHFFEHMAFKGTKKYPNAKLISQTIDSIGGDFNAFTAKDHTGYWVKAPRSHFNTVIDLLSDMIRHPLLETAEIEREKGVIVEEINMYEDMPARKVGDVFDDIMFPGHPLGYDIAGTAKTVRSFSKATFTHYLADHYHSANTVLVIAGGLNHEKGVLDNYLGDIEKKLGSWGKHKKKGFVKFEYLQKKPEIKIHFKKTEQAHIALGFRAFSQTDPRRYVLSVLAAILGGSMSSRLFTELRERRGLCYYISTSRDLYEDTGYIVTQAGVTNNFEKVQEAIKLILKEHKNIAEGSLGDIEIKRVKEMLKGRLLLSLEDSHDAASFIGGRYLFEKELINPDMIIQSIDKVTKDQLIETAKMLFLTNQLNIAVIGPFKNHDIKIDF